MLSAGWLRAVTATASGAEAVMKLIGILVVVWLVIGTVAGLQRHYYTGEVSCAKAGSVAATIVAGPLNYVGINPIIHCTVPRPSR